MTAEMKEAFLEALTTDADFANAVASAIGKQSSVMIDTVYMGQDVKRLLIRVGNEELYDTWTQPEPCRCNS